LSDVIIVEGGDHLGIGNDKPVDDQVGNERADEMPFVMDRTTRTGSGVFFAPRPSKWYTRRPKKTPDPLAIINSLWINPPFISCPLSHLSYPCYPCNPWLIMALSAAIPTYFSGPMPILFEARDLNHGLHG